jgi:hypothetical protein
MTKRKNNAAKRAAKRPVPVGLIEPPEEGLSVDSDELGASFLRYATEQGNFEGARAEPLEFAPPVEPPSDDAPRESATPANNLWDRTVERMSAARNENDPAPTEDTEGAATAHGVRADER